MGWDPVAYLKYGGERTRPAADLLARVPETDPNVIYDLGCGPGNSTALLSSRWPAAHLTGLDADPTMLARARKNGPRARWSETDIETWEAPQPADLIFSNAVLHWLDHHDRLFPRLIQQLRSGGILAVQMPRNHHAPSHALLRELARSSPWASQLESILRDEPVASPEAYWRWLSPHCSELEIWETTYLMPLRGQDPILAWIKGSSLRPVLAALAPEDALTFEQTLAAQLREAYPAEDDGCTLFPFRRLFILATR